MFKTFLKSVTIIALSLSQIGMPLAYAAPPTKGNATWVYDAQYTAGPTGAPFNKAGLFKGEITDYNKVAAGNNKDNVISVIFTYGGSVSQYCKGSGISTQELQETPEIRSYLSYIPCIIDFRKDKYYNVGYSNMWVGYDTDPIGAKPKKNQGDTGKQSTAAYKDVTGAKYIIPIVDGRLGDSGLYLTNFDKNLRGYMISETGDKIITRANAVLAQAVARLYCADNNVAGLQVDLEPFDIDSPGQQNFYTTLSGILASKTFGCVNNTFPQGRSISNFAFPGKWNQDGSFTPFTANQWQAFKKAFGKNGYFMVSGYDLGPGDPGQANTLQDYARYLYDELYAMKNNGNGIYYMIGIPAAASTKEFTELATFPATTGKKSGYTQLDYVKVIMGIMFDKDNSGKAYNSYIKGLLPDKPPYTTPLNLKGDSHFLGWSMWSWATYLSYPPHSNSIYLPNQPPADVLAYLAGAPVGGTGKPHYTVNVITSAFPQPVQLQGDGFTYSEAGGSKTICTGGKPEATCKDVNANNGTTSFQVPLNANFTILSKADGKEICKVPANKKDPVAATEVWPPSGFTGTYNWRITSNGTATGNSASCNLQISK